MLTTFKRYGLAQLVEQLTLINRSPVRLRQPAPSFNITPRVKRTLKDNYGGVWAVKGDGL